MAMCFKEDWFECEQCSTYCCSLCNTTQHMWNCWWPLLSWMDSCRQYYSSAVKPYSHCIIKFYPSIFHLQSNQAPFGINTRRSYTLYGYIQVHLKRSVHKYTCIWKGVCVNEAKVWGSSGVVLGNMYLETWNSGGEWWGGYSGWEHWGVVGGGNPGWNCGRPQPPRTNYIRPAMNVIIRSSHLSSASLLLSSASSSSLLTLFFLSHWKPLQPWRTL